MTETTIRRAQARDAQPDEADAKPGRRERNKREKLARILAAARTLFHKQGFAETTTQEIADLADIGSGTLFLYAKFKEDLLVLVFKGEISDVMDRAYASRPKNGDLLDQVMHIFGAFVTYHRQDLALSSALIKEVTLLTNPERRADMSDLMNRIYDRLAAIVEGARSAGAIRADVDPRTAARNLFALYYINLIEWLGGFTSQAQFRESLRSMLQLQLDGLSAPGASERRPAGARARRATARS